MTPSGKNNRLMMLLRGLEVGGLEKMAVDLANHLSPRYQVTLCCYDSLGPLKSRLSPDLETVFIPRNPGFDIFFIFRLFRFMRKRKIDILHTHNHTAFFYGTIAAWMAGVRRIVYTEHGRTEPLSRKARISYRFLIRRVDRIIVVAEYLKDLLVKIDGFPDHKIQWIPNGVDGSAYTHPFDRTELARELGLDPSDRLVGNVARLDPIKNHSLLLKAMKRVLEKEAHCRLLIIGDGPSRKSLEEESLGLGLKDAVLFLGERTDIERILPALDIFVLSSKSEGMSLTLMEAMAARLPIVATKVGGNSALITSGENGLLVPSENPDALAEAIIKVLRNRDLARGFSDAGRKRFEKEFTLEIMVKRYCEAYEP